MVDYASYFQYGLADGRNGSLPPSENQHLCGCTDCKSNVELMKLYRTRFDDNQEGEWEDEKYLICPPRVLGYVLSEKQWAQLQVTYLSEIASDGEQDAWESRLKLANNDTKKLLFDLVRCHTSSDAKDGGDNQLEVDDIVPGKGKGIVILLYGKTNKVHYFVLHSLMAYRPTRSRQDFNCRDYCSCGTETALLD